MKIGTKVKVIKNDTSHDFTIGEEVYYLGRYSDVHRENTGIFSRNATDRLEEWEFEEDAWFMNEDEYKIIQETMEKNEIKKALYKENKKARLVGISKDGLSYYTEVSSSPYPESVGFQIPLKEIGDAKFYSEMEAKHLIRWLI